MSETAPRASGEERGGEVHSRRVAKERSLYEKNFFLSFSFTVGEEAAGVVVGWGAGVGRRER